MRQDVQVHPKAAPPSPVVARKPSWYRRLYRRVEALSLTRHAFTAMLLVSVIDASFFPVPPFALLIPMVFAHPARWWRLALWGTVASAGGGLIGYGLGAFFGEVIATTLHVDLNLHVRSEWLGVDATLGQLLGDELWILALLASILPTPFKVVAIGSGILGVPLERFMLAAVIGRAVRFFLVAAAMRFVGPSARKWLRL